MKEEINSGKKKESRFFGKTKANSQIYHRKRIAMTMSLILLFTVFFSAAVFFPTASAQSQMPSYYGWDGYKGNETVYLTTSVSDFNAILPSPTNSTWGQQNGDNSSTVTNVVSLGVGGIANSSNEDSQMFEEYYDHNTQMMRIYVPVTAGGVSNWTYKYNFQNPADSYTLAIDNEQMSVNMPVHYPSSHIWLDTTYDSGINVSSTSKTGENLSQVGWNTLWFILGSLPPPFGQAASTASYEYSLYQTAGLVSNPSTGMTGPGNFTDANFGLEYERTTTGGSGGYNLWGYDTYGVTTIYDITIGVRDFQNASQIIFGTNNVEQTISSAGQTISTYKGAYSAASINVVPSTTITGTVENNNVAAANQAILLTQTDKSTGAVTQFYETTDSSGNYRFLARPDSMYELQVVTPNGLTAGSFTNISRGDYNSTSLNLNLNIPGTVVFSETGLPSGISWYVATSDGQNISSTASSISISLPYGTYSYTIGGATGYYPSPESGSIDVNQIGVQQNVSFSPVGTVTFTESGLASGTSWSVTLSNVGTKSSTTSSIEFQNVYYGTYTYTYGTVSGYTMLYYSGSVTLDSGSTSVTNNYEPIGTVTFTESGLPSGYSWSVNLNGVTETGTAGTSIVFSNEVYADYQFVVTPPSGYTASPQSGYINLQSPSVSQNIAFSVYVPPPSTYPVTFKESGLPSGTDWGVTLNGNFKQGTSSSISFSEPDGSYSYSVKDASYNGVIYYPSPSSGTVNVNGGGVTVNIAYSASSCVYALTKIMMANGTYEFAENITAGESIMTYNLSTGVLEPEIVLHAYEVNQSGMYTINGMLRIAPDQKVLTERGYIEAQNLTMNDTVYDVYTQNWEQVRSISSATGSYAMYDFYVGVNHNYIVWAYVLQDKIA